jgi:hypothetical protein
MAMSPMNNIMNMYSIFTQRTIFWTFEFDISVVYNYNYIFDKRPDVCSIFARSRRTNQQLFAECEVIIGDHCTDPEVNNCFSIIS